MRQPRLRKTNVIALSDLYLLKYNKKKKNGHMSQSSKTFIGHSDLKITVAYGKLNHILLSFGQEVFATVLWPEHLLPSGGTILLCSGNLNSHLPRGSETQRGNPLLPRVLGKY